MQVVSIKQYSSHREDNIPAFITRSQVHLKGKQYKKNSLKHYEHAHRSLSNTKTMRAVHELWDASLCRGQNKNKACTATAANASKLFICKFVTFTSRSRAKKGPSRRCRVIMRHMGRIVDCDSSGGRNCLTGGLLTAHGHFSTLLQPQTQPAALIK